MLIAAIVIITLALVLYSIGVWGVRVQHALHWWHVAFFALGLAADMIGTYLMTQIAAERRANGDDVTWLNAFMNVSGTLAILLMAIHLVWAVVVLIRGREKEKSCFRRWSVLVWIVWLIPYAAGAAGAMIA
ncbi:HsmA family protein [Microbacter sp. GSS18]|nr:HsmA family protein [Microbacter sp. GSS18]